MPLPPSHPPAALRVISSMATRQLLADLAQAYQQQHGRAVAVESVGGVDAARRVQAGEDFDGVVLAADAMAQLGHSGATRAGSRVDLVLSVMALAVQTDTPLPDIGSEAALKSAVLAASRVAYSTGPSGTYLMALFAAWGISEKLEGRLLLAPPGVPVASLISGGQAELGFQQRSELLGVPGITVLHPLPGAANFVTTFAGAVCAASARQQEAAEFLAYLAAPEAFATIRRHGMQPTNLPQHQPGATP